MPNATNDVPVIRMKFVVDSLEIAFTAQIFKKTSKVFTLYELFSNLNQLISLYLIRIFLYFYGLD